MSAACPNPRAASEGLVTTRPPDPDLGTAAPARHLVEAARRLIAHDDTHPHLGLPWADDAHRACQQLYGPGHHRTFQAARAHTRALIRHGQHEHAADLMQDLLEAQPEQSPHPNTIGVRITLAAELHAAGRCGQAIREISHALSTARTHLDRPLLAATGTAVYLGMLTACGRHAEAAGLRRTARTWLPASYQPGSRAFGVLSALHAPEAREHTDVCAAHLDTLLVEPVVTPSPPYPMRVRERLARWGVAITRRRFSVTRWWGRDRS